MPPATLALPATPKSEPTDHKYITRTPGINGGEPTIVDSGIAVRHVVSMLRLDYYTPEVLVTQAYPHLTLAQVYDALSYYHDHTAEIEQLIWDKNAREEHRALNPVKPPGSPSVRQLAAAAGTR